MVMRALKSILILLAMVVAANAQNPPTNYGAATTPYTGTETWYCEPTPGTLNRQCSFAGITTSITSLPNLVGVGTLTSGAAGAGFTIQGANVTWTGVGITAGNGITIGGSWPTQSVTYKTPASSITSVSAPGGSSSASFVMMGIAGTVTPTNTGTVLVAAYVSMQNTANSGQCAIRVRHGAGGAPTNGQAVTGTAVGSVMTTTMDSLGSPRGMSVTVVITGLALNTARWLDLSFQADGTNTCTPFDATVTAGEL
jgi:hypothetical protein